MNATPPVSKEILAHDFRTRMHGKMEPELVEACTNALSEPTKVYPANGGVASLVFYLKFTVKITSEGGKAFSGNAGGASLPGGGALFGDVYTNDLDALYAHTKSFEFNATPVYLSILFFDEHAHLLGHFQSAAVSTVLGVGGGAGHWD